MTGYKNGKARPPLNGAAAPDEQSTAVPADSLGSETPPASQPELRELRDDLGRFRPGVSGCPGGRTRAELEIRNLAQSHGGTAIERLVELTKSTNERVAVTACEVLLNRGCGTPRQSIDLEASIDSRTTNAEPAEPTTLEDAERVYLDMVRGSAS
jgi:hypothetical protein